MTWLQTSGENVLLNLHIQPGAKQTDVIGTHGDALKIRLASPPVDGKANEVLIALLAETLGIAKSRLSLVSGQTSRIKRVSIANVSAAEVEQKLCPAGKVG